MANGARTSSLIHSHIRSHVEIKPARRRRIGTPQFPDAVASTPALLPSDPRGVLPDLPDVPHPRGPEGVPTVVARPQAHHRIVALPGALPNPPVALQFTGAEVHP